MIAYEPVWAIGTGEVATPDDAQEVCAAIRAQVREVHGDAAADAVRILYGGSVKAANVGGIMAQRRRRRLSRGRREPAGGRVRRHLPLLRHAGPLIRRTSDVGSAPVTLLFTIMLMITSGLMILLVLLHKGRGGGLSDMFGGGVSSSLGGSSVAERNLDRLTVGIGVIWFACVIALGLLLAY